MTSFLIFRIGPVACPDVLLPGCQDQLEWVWRITNHLRTYAHDRMGRGHIVVEAKPQIVGGDDQEDPGRRAAAPGRGDRARSRRAVAARWSSRCARAGLGKDRGAVRARQAAT